MPSYHPSLLVITSLFHLTSVSCREYLTYRHYTSSISLPPVTHFMTFFISLNSYMCTLIFPLSMLRYISLFNLRLMFLFCLSFIYLFFAHCYPTPGDPMTFSIYCSVWLRNLLHLLVHSLHTVHITTCYTLFWLVTFMLSYQSPQPVPIQLAVYSSLLSEFLVCFYSYVASQTLSFDIFNIGNYLHKCLAACFSRKPKPVQSLKPPREAEATPLESMNLSRWQFRSLVVLYRMQAATSLLFHCHQVS